MPLLDDPMLAEYVRRALEAQTGPVAPDPDLEAAKEADRKATREAQLAAGMQQAASLIRNQPERIAPVAPVDTAMRDWVMGQKAAADKRREPLDVLSKLAALSKEQDPDALPPPPEWGAPASVATRKEARALGWGPKAPDAEKAADPMKGPPSPKLREALKAAGQEPDIFPTTQSALQALNARSLIPFSLQMGADEQLYAIPTKGGDLTPRPVPSPRGGAGGFRKDKDLSPKEIADLSKIAEDIGHIEALAAEFKPEFAGKGALGGADVWLAQKAGSWGTEGQQKLAEFWSRYEQLINIPQRHERFGSALTPQEKQSWDAARNIRPGTDPGIAIREFQRLAQIAKNALQRIGDAKVAEGYGAEGVRAATGGRYGQGGGAALSEEDAQAKAWAEANPNDPRAAKILARLKAKGL